MFKPKSGEVIIQFVIHDESWKTRLFRWLGYVLITVVAVIVVYGLILAARR